MVEINKRNLVDETAAVYAANTIASNPTPLFSTGVPAKIARVSMANTNLLSNDGDLFVGTGDTYTETIDGTTYTYAKIAKKNQSELFVDGLNSTATNVGLAANVGKFIDDRLCISNSTASGIGSIALGYNASTTNDQAVAIGYEAIATGGSTAIGNRAKISTAITNAIQLGSGTNSTMNSFQVSKYQMLDLSTGKMPLERIEPSNIDSATTIALGTIGAESVDNIKGSVLIGFNITGGKEGKESDSKDNIIIGNNSSAFGSSIAIGARTKANGFGHIAIGCDASTNGEMDYGISIGDYAKCTGDVTSIQLGFGTNSTGGFQVWSYQLMDTNGMIPKERLGFSQATIKGSGNGSLELIKIYSYVWMTVNDETQRGFMNEFADIKIPAEFCSSDNIDILNTLGSYSGGLATSATLRLKSDGSFTVLSDKAASIWLNGVVGWKID